MTRFWRDGHYRTSRYGDVHWVEGHWVERYDWDRYSTYIPPPPPRPPVQRQTNTIQSAVADGRLASFTIPNATCPVCGARVFFYQNEYGSRVFFDDLGPPWPKHPCTDSGAASARTLGTTSPVGLTGPPRAAARPRPDLPAAALADATAGGEGGPLVRTPDGWDRCIVKRSTGYGALAHFVVRNTTDPTDRSVRFSTAARPDLPSAGETLFLKEDRMSFFSFEKFEPQEVIIERKRTKAASASRRAAKRRRARKKRR